MKTMPNEMLNKLKEILNSKEGKDRMEEYFGGLKKKEIIKRRWIDKCIKLLQSDKDINLLYNKFDKHYQKRRDILFEQGVDGYSDLSDIVLGAFSEIGEDCLDDLVDAIFTVEAYKYKGIIVELMIGQGSAILIYEENGK